MIETFYFGLSLGSQQVIIVRWPGIHEIEVVTGMVWSTGSPVEPSADNFWQDAYRIRQLPDGRPACPRFLLPHVPHVLAAGKAAILLRHSNRGGGRRNRWGPESLLRWLRLTDGPVNISV